MSLKVTKWVEVETEVTVHVSASDIASALADMGGAGSARAALMCLNSVAVFMKGLPDEIIARMTDDHRRLTYNFLQEQAQRFAPPPAPGEGHET